MSAKQGRESEREEMRDWLEDEANVWGRKDSKREEVNKEKIKYLETENGC